VADDVSDTYAEEVRRKLLVGDLRTENAAMREALERIDALPLDADITDAHNISAHTLASLSPPTEDDPR